MGRHKIYCRLSEQSFKDAAEEVRQYKDELNKKCIELVNRLADKGINVVQDTIREGNWGKYIIISKKINTDQIESIVCISNTGLIKSQWENKDGIQEVDISPILMCEFGSGFGADNPMNIPGVGQGSLNTMGHAFDPNGWWWKDLDGGWHHMYGTKANLPMYNAYKEMIQECTAIAKQVFQ